jgi:hypothetical protein
MKTVFLRVTDADDKAAALRAAIHEPEATSGRQRFEIDAESFASVPQSPFVYRVPAPMLALAANRKTLAATGAKAKQGFGAATRFHRLVWEVKPSELGMGRRWLWLAHGTKPVTFFKPTFHVVLWANHGREAKADVTTRYPYLNGNYGFKIQAEEDYGRQGLCYGKRTGRFTVQVMPPGHAFSFEGTAIHADASVNIWNLLALLNSQPVAFWLNNVSAQHKTYSYVDTTPVPVKTDDALSDLALRGWQCQFQLRRTSENSNYFVLPALLLSEGATFALRANARADFTNSIEVALSEVQDEIDERCFNLYEIDDTDRLPITLSFEGDGLEGRSSSGLDSDTEDEVDDEDSEVRADLAGLAMELLSWLVGVAFGRFDVRLATGMRSLPTVPEPFDPLPVCSPAMLTGEDGLPVTKAPAGYQFTFPENGILVDDRGHARDLIAAVRAVFEEVFTTSADLRWNELSVVIEPKKHDLRTWVASSFFEYHLKRYSKGRRKAPILWQLSVSSGRYSVWLYAHRLTRDTFFQIQNDIMMPKLAHEERQLTALIESAGATPSARERKDIEAQESFVEELHVLLGEVKRVAPLWEPTLDDGVVLTMAPLWRLAAQHKPWQKELKSKWDELVAGKHDWARIAMHLWPERVVVKCTTDRSLAIAHGLEQVFWTDGGAGEWQVRPTTTHFVDELVRERSSIAVKAALSSLLESPVVNANSNRGRVRRTSKTASDLGMA